MTKPATLDDARRLVLATLTDVAPDLEPESLADTDRLQEDLDLDSMDVLNLFATLSECTGIDIPESDYGRLGTIAGCAGYLAERA
jgi:acyl carrier protein